MKRCLQCAEQQESASNFSKYCACHTKWLSWLILVTHETLFKKMRGVTSVIVQTHQILRLPRKMNLMIDPCHTWNAICNARSNKCHCPNSPNTAPATKNESHDWSLSHMKCYLQCAEQQVSLSKLTKYCACHEKWISWLILVTHETLFTMRGATSVIVQTHQILRLPRKMNLMIKPCQTWNASYNARSNKCHCPNSPNTAPATKNDRPESQRYLLKTDETSFPMRGRSEHDPRMIRAWSEHDPRMKPSVRNPPRNRGYLSRPPRAFCIEKYNISCSRYHSKFHRILRLPRKVPLELHQILRLPRKVTLIIDPLHTWNVIYNARSNKCHCPNSPNTAPATKNESHDWSASHMKRYLQCAEQQVSLSKLTKYCACHAKWISWLILDTNETLFTMRGATCVIVQTHQILRLPRKMTVPNLKEICWKRMKRHFQCAADPRMIRAWSDHDPSMIRPWSDHETVSPQPASQPRLPFTPTTSILYWKIQHFALRLSFQISPNTAPATKSDSSTTPNTAPATKNESHDWSLSHMKRYLQCAEQQGSLSKLTKYCACHAKWPSWSILFTHETLFTMRGVTSVIVQLHQILRLPRKMNLMIDPWHKWNVIYNARSNMRHSPNSPNTAPATKNDRPESQRNLLKTDETSFPMRGRSEHDPRMIRAWSEHDPRMKPSVRNPPRNRGYLSRPPRAFCIEKYNISRSGYHSKFHRILRLPRKVTVQHHQILRLPRKVTLIIDPNSPNAAPATKSDTSTSPNTAPATELWLDDTYYLTTPTTWRHLLLDDITWRHLILDDT